MFGATQEMVVSMVATHPQTLVKLVLPSLDVSKNSRHICHGGLLDYIAQARLPLSFVLEDVIFGCSFSCSNGNTTWKDYCKRFGTYFGLQNVTNSDIFFSRDVGSKFYISSDASICSQDVEGQSTYAISKGSSSYH